MVASEFLINTMGEATSATVLAEAILGNRPGANVQCAAKVARS